MNPFLVRLTETATEPAQNGSIFQGMDDMLSILMIIMLAGCTIYFFYTYLRLRKEYYLFPNKFMYPGGCKPEDCLDVDGFIDFILPKLLIFSFLFLLCTIGYGLIIFYTPLAGTLADIASILVPPAILVWYIFVQRKAAREFWGA